MFCKLRTVIALLWALKKHQHGDENREISVTRAEFVENTAVQKSIYRFRSKKRNSFPLIAKKPLFS